MTYLDLLHRIENKTNPQYVMFNSDLYKWDGKNYSLNYNSDDHITDILDEVGMVLRNCIWEVEVKKDEPETKTLGDIIAEKCF